jgi:hypothetical protein
MGKAKTKICDEEKKTVKAQISDFFFAITNRFCQARKKSEISVSASSVFLVGI